MAQFNRLGFPGGDDSGLPEVVKKAQTADEYGRWLTSKEMKGVLAKLGECVIRLRDAEGGDLMTRRCIFILLAVESICRQQRQVEIQGDLTDDMTEGANFVLEMVEASASEYGGTKAFEDAEFWRTLIMGLCIVWGTGAREMNLTSDRLYSVQIRRLRDVPPEQRN